MSTRALDLADYVRELTEPHTHVEHYQVRIGDTWYGRNHLLRVPALLVQLQTARPVSSGYDEGRRAGYASQPACSVDALDTARRIDDEAARWVRRLGEDDPGDSLDRTTGLSVAGSGALRCVRRLHGLSAGLDPAERDAVTRDVRRWWAQARVLTGWDVAPWTPDATCPACGEHGTVRVRLIDEAATCTADECRATWSAGTIGVLADHIRAESERRHAERRAGFAIRTRHA